jgi:hypothetical protein
VRVCMCVNACVCVCVCVCCKGGTEAALWKQSGALGQAVAGGASDERGQIWRGGVRVTPEARLCRGGPSNGVANGQQASRWLRWLVARGR